MSDELNNGPAEYFIEFRFDCCRSLFIVDVTDAECIERLILRLVELHDSVAERIDLRNNS
jgi:hypothetical protein